MFRATPASPYNPVQPLRGHLPSRNRPPSVACWTGRRPRTGGGESAVRKRLGTDARDAALLGHRQPSMTLRYAHVGDSEIEAAAERVGQAISRLMAGSLPGTTNDAKSW